MTANLHGVAWQGIEVIANPGGCIRGDGRA